MPTQQKRSILCPSCKKLISIDEPRCPYCGIAHPGAWWKNNLWVRIFFSGDRVIWAIIYTNIGMYLISLLLNPRLSGLSINPFSLLSPANKSLLLMGATGTFPIDRLHRWWTLLSANYLHGGILHILFNMVAFRQIVPLILREYGTYRMIVLYTLSGVIGFLISYLFGVAFTIGASAAVCGLIGAALYYGKSRGGSYGQAIYKQIGGWALGILIFGLLMPGVNNWGHGGGIFAGVILGLFLGYHEKKRENYYHKILAIICIILTSIVLVWAVSSSIYYRFMR